MLNGAVFFFSSRRRHTRSLRDWSSDVCSSDLSVGRRARQILGLPSGSSCYPITHTANYPIQSGSVLGLEKCTCVPGVLGLVWECWSDYPMSIISLTASCDTRP